MHLYLKPKHKKMKESVDFIKIRDYAVININNMVPVPEGEYHLFFSDWNLCNINIQYGLYFNKKTKL